MKQNFDFKTVHVLCGLIVAATLSILTACKSYHLGSPAEIPFQSIYIKPVSNHSFAAQAQPIISAQLREAFLQDGRAKIVASKKNADAVLYVDLTEYKRSGAARSSQDTTIADIFDLQLTATVSLLDQKNGLYLFENRSIQATTNAYIGDPYADDPIITYQISERQAMEQLARELSRKITNEVLNPW